MISRVAEHCYWMSRYLERTENTARVLDVNCTLLLDFEVPIEQQWKPLLIISGIEDYTGKADAETVQHFLTWQEDNRSSIVSSMTAARENARVVREIISNELWERVNFYYHWLQSPLASGLYSRDRNEFYGQVKRINQLVHGIGEATTSRDEAWDFYLLGRYLERACQTGRILDVKYHILLPTPEQIGTPVDGAYWAAILKSCSGYEVFHKRRTTADLGSGVVEFLVFDNLFPRSIRHCINACRLAAHRISGRKRYQAGNEPERLLDALLDWLNLVTVDDLVRTGLHESLTAVIDRTQEIGDAVRRTFFEAPIEFAPTASQSQVQAGA
jgi:uncharacterized alpha-E superfamily protein